MDPSLFHRLQPPPASPATPALIPGALAPSAGPDALHHKGRHLPLLPVPGLATWSCLHLRSRRVRLKFCSSFALDSFQVLCSDIFLYNTTFSSPHKVLLHQIPDTVNCNRKEGAQLCMHPTLSVTHTHAHTYTCEHKRPGTLLHQQQDGNPLVWNHLSQFSP